MFTAFAQKFLLFLGVLAFVSILVFSSLVGWLGHDAQLVITSYWDGLKTSYYANEEAFQGLAKLLSAILTVATGVFAIHKSWYYAEHQLPARLEDFIRERERDFLATREDLYETVKSSTYFGEPIIDRGRFNLFLDRFGIRPRRAVSANLIENIKWNRDQIEVLKARIAEVKTEVVTGYVLHGTHQARQAALAGNNTRSKDIFNRAATDAFEAALKIKGADPYALEFAAKHARAQGRFQKALEYLDKLISARAASALEKGRAYRLQAEILWASNIPNKLDEAWRSAKSARDTLEVAIGQESNKKLELGWAELVLGRIQIRRDRPRAAATALKRAEFLFKNISNKSQRSEAFEALKTAKSEFEVARQENQN